MNTYEIPLTPQSQTFLISLAGTQYQITVTWRDAAQAWFIDVADANGNAMVSGIPLVTGVDLLAPYKYLGINGQMWVTTDGDPDAVPTFTNLGVSSHLLFLSVN